ncbi:MAG: thermosome subunit [Candidatus Lokiarchaeota archaeon]|nr:thermosome subunit [Candidatus Lokiarchaeota archaeon]
MSQLGGVPVIILKEGTESTKGKGARSKNIQAIQAVAEAVKTTLGPRGMDKMLVDSLGDVTITNDGATILDKLDVDHPGAKMAVEIAKNQDDQVGDGTTSAVIVAAQLLIVAEELMEQGVHPNTIANGFRKALTKTLEIINEIAKDTENDPKILKQCAITTMNSKGVAGQKEFFADIAVDVMLKVYEEGNTSYESVKNVVVLKKKGKSLKETEVISGIVLEKEPVHPLMPKFITGGLKIATIAHAFEIKKTEFSSELRITSADQMQQFLDREEEVMKKFADKLKEMGVQVVINQKGIEDTAAHYLNKAGIFAVKSVTKSDLEKLARATGASIVEDIFTMDESDLGFAEEIECKSIAGDDLIFISGCKDPKTLTVLIRGGTNSVIEEAERTLHDALSVIGTLLDKKRYVGGGGAVEMEISARLLDFSSQEKGKEQLAIESFARSLECIPITLAENAGIEPIDIIAKLRSKHAKPGNDGWGLEIYEGKPKNNYTTGVIEPAASIQTFIKSSTELAVLILRIDEMIKARKTEGPPPGMGGMGGMPPGMGGMGGMGGMPPGMGGMDY